jgi:hypothetical protein
MLPHQHNQQSCFIYFRYELLTRRVVDQNNQRSASGNTLYLSNLNTMEMAIDEIMGGVGQTSLCIDVFNCSQFDGMVSKLAVNEPV